MTGFPSKIEMQSLRLLPINHCALLKLKEAGSAAADHIQPVFQLMNWGLASGIPLTHHRTAAELLRLSHQADQRAALDYLLKNLPGGAKKLARELLRMRPRAAAHALLDILDMRLKADPRTPYPAER